MREKHTIASLFATLVVGRLPPTGVQANVENATLGDAPIARHIPINISSAWTNILRPPSYPVTFRPIAGSRFCGQPWQGRSRLQTCKEQARQRRTLTTLPRLGAKANGRKGRKGSCILVIVKAACKRLSRRSLNLNSAVDICHKRAQRAHR
jgi:hypothetical protein